MKCRKRGAHDSRKISIIVLVMSSPLRIQLPDRCHQTTNTTRSQQRPPLEPPPFRSSDDAPLTLRRCVKHSAKVRRLDYDRPDSMEEFLILTSVNVSVESMLSVPDPWSTNVGCADDDGDNSGSEEDDMFCDSSSDEVSDDYFLDSDDEEESDDEMKGEEEARIMEGQEEADDEGGRDDARNNCEGVRNMAQCTEVPNSRGSPMKAFLKGKKPLVKVRPKKRTSSYAHMFRNLMGARIRNFIHHAPVIIIIYIDLLPEPSRSVPHMHLSRKSAAKGRHRLGGNRRGCCHERNVLGDDPVHTGEDVGGLRQEDRRSAVQIGVAPDRNEGEIDPGHARPCCRRNHVGRVECIRGHAI